MNEGAKTGIFWAVAVALLAVAIFVSVPTQTVNETQSLIGNPLFPAFTDPLAANSLRVMSFNGDQGEVSRFEVAKDETSGVWALPSRNGYPADAAEQMQKAANALVGLKVLDIQTENAEDHAKLGVVEPKPESLEIGDEGVGRSVTIRGDKNQSLASLIIGNKVGEEGNKRYVRIPNQDPVYVVNLDDTVFSSRFEDWIEKDLLQLSSIDIGAVGIQSYNAAIEQTGAVSLNRSYDAQLNVDGANNWELKSLNVYDDQQQPQPRTLAEGEKLSTSKLNTLKNSLDELKIADVAAKPKGMSENLKADKDLVSDNDAIRSLAARGFFPISTGDIISANGEMNVTLNDGVQYILRFGNVQGLSDEKPADGEAAEGAEKPATTGANRYLLITAQVDESNFPPPELKPIPNSIEELEAMDRAAAEAAEPPMSEPAPPAAETPADAPADMPAEDKPAEEPAPADKPAEDKPAEEPAPAESDAPAAEPAKTEEPAAEPAATEDAAPAEPASDDNCGDDPAQTEPASDAPQSTETPAEPATPAESPATPEPAAEPTQAPATEQPATEPAPANEPAPAPAQPAEAAAPAAPAEPEETAEEKQERLEATQEQITKENQRLLDQRKEKLEAARRRVRELNSRFAQWYYVIPESTYRNLQISLDDLIEEPTPAADAANPLEGNPAAAPSFNIPGLN